MNIRRVSKESGFSLATVSRALRGDPKVREQSRLHIEETARRLGYNPNPLVRQVMSSCRRRNTQVFRGNLALLVKNVSQDSLADRRRRDVVKAASAAAEIAGFSVDTFDLDHHSTDGIQRIFDSRNIQGVLVFMPSVGGKKVRLRLNTASRVWVSAGWGLWVPQFDTVRGDYYQVIRLALHHAKRTFSSGIAAIWDFPTDAVAHNVARASFLAHHPGGNQMASKLFLSLDKLGEKQFANLVKKYSLRCLILESSIAPPDWLARHVPHEGWIWCRDPGDQPYFGRIDHQNSLMGEWGVNLLTAKIQMGHSGVPAYSQTILVPPRWIANKS